MSVNFKAFLAIITRIQQSRANKLLAPSCITEIIKLLFLTLTASRIP